MMIFVLSLLSVFAAVQSFYYVFWFPASSFGLFSLPLRQKERAKSRNYVLSSGTRQRQGADSSSDE